ncbi:MAG: hypothetical protein ACE5F7_01475, partial [Nitrospiria bacterium]
TGFSFLLPRHFRGSYDPRTGLFFMKNRSGLFIGAMGFSEATLDEARAAALAAVKKMGIQIKFQEERHLDQNTLLAHFSTQSKNGPGIMAAIAEAGKTGNALAMIAFGKPEHKERVTKKVMRVMARVDWRAPKPPKGLPSLAGKVLEKNGGAANIVFCENGRYRAGTEIESFFSRGGTAKKSGRKDPLQGTWRVTADLVGNSVLILNGTDGRFFQWPLQEDGDGLNINGASLALRHAKQACQE